MTTHVRGKHHIEMAKASSSRSVTSFFRPQTPQSVIEAESLGQNLFLQIVYFFLEGHTRPEILNLFFKNLLT